MSLIISNHEEKRSSPLKLRITNFFVILSLLFTQEVGNLDKRFKANRYYFAHGVSSRDEERAVYNFEVKSNFSITNESFGERPVYKKDGTLDRRYKVNRKYMNDPSLLRAFH